MFNENLTKPITIPHSWKKINPVVTTTFNAGDIVPFFNMAILPNDRISLAISTVTNMTTPNYATMDTLQQFIAFFYEPFRNELEKGVWDKFYGEGTNNPYDTEVEIFLPQMKHPDGGWEEGTVADYMGLNTKRRCHDVCALPFRIFARIVDEYFRDEQRQEHYLISLGTADQKGTNGSNYINDLQNGGKVPQACKLFDYYTGTKLQIQAGDAVKLPAIGATSAPVVGDGTALGLEARIEGGKPFDNEIMGLLAAGPNSVGDNYFTASSNARGMNITEGLTVGGGGSEPYAAAPVGVTSNALYSGLKADLSNVEGISITEFKKLLMSQQILQNIQDGGSRYIEQLYKRWGVKDANELEMEIPICLGVSKTILNMQMVAGTAPSEKDGNYKFGSITGLSNTSTQEHIFNHHFKQHGWLFGIVVIRPFNSYQDGINKTLVIKSRKDLLQPEMVHLGPAPVFNYEIYSDQADNKDDKVFGFRNYGDEYRYIPNLVTGQIRKNSAFSQDYKTYALSFDKRPINNEEFILSSKKQVDKTLTVDSTKQHQFTFQAMIEINMRRNLPENGNGEALIRI